MQSLLRFVFVISVCLATGSLSGQTLQDGDFESLAAGSQPDCGTPAGTWSFPNGLCECVGNDIEIVPTASFDPQSTGQSLHFDVDVDALDYCSRPMHITNLFAQSIFESTDTLVIVAFDIFLPDPGVGGGNVYISGDHGGGGFSNETDRGPQLGWHPDGRLTSFGRTLIAEYPWEEWQSVRLEIDLVADTFTFLWKAKADMGPMLVLGEDLPFHRDRRLNFLDRFSVAHFTNAPNEGDVSKHAYFDNVQVSEEPKSKFRRGDCNDDGAVDLSDASCILNWQFLGGSPPGCVAATNTNGDKGIDIADAIYLLGSLFLGSPPPAPPFPGCGPGTLPVDDQLGCEAPNC